MRVPEPQADLGRDRVFLWQEGALVLGWGSGDGFSNT